MPVRNEQSENATVVEDQQQLAVAGGVGQAADAEGGERPGQRQGAGEHADLGVGEAEVGLDERHQEIERVAVEEDDAEVEAEQPDQQGLIEGGGSRLFRRGGAAHAKGRIGSRPSQPTEARQKAVKACSMPGVAVISSTKPGSSDPRSM